MAIAYRMTVNERVLHVHASGKDESEDEVKQYGMAVIENAASAGVERVLCDERSLEYAIGTLSNYEAAKFIADAAPAVCRVAIVCSARDAEDGAFWENVAVNRGLNVRVTTDYAMAKAWVEEGLDRT